MANTIDVKLLTPAFKADPHPTYARLREESPVHQVPLPDGRKIWIVTRYDDVIAAFKDERFVKDFRSVLTPEQSANSPYHDPAILPFMNNMLSADGAAHTRLRAIVQKAFTVPFVERLRDRIQTIADQLLDAVAARGEMDLIDDYAFQLPIFVIAEMLGVPTEDRHKIRTWQGTFVATLSKGKDALEQARPDLAAYLAYVTNLCEVYRKSPGANLISTLVQIEEQGDKLSHDELIATVLLLISAGHETTTNLLANGMRALLVNPDQLSALQRDPSLIKSAVEELIRYDGPLEATTSRFAREDMEFLGVRMRKGELVFLVLASANRDSSHFKDPEKLDICRAENKHLGLGHGAHYCLGAPLGRMEAQIGISTLLRRFPDIQLAVPPEQLVWRPHIAFRGLASLPVKFSVPR